MALHIRPAAAKGVLADSEARIPSVGDIACVSADWFGVGSSRATVRCADNGIADHPTVGAHRPSARSGTTYPLPTPRTRTAQPAGSGSSSTAMESGFSSAPGMQLFAPIKTACEARGPIPGAHEKISLGLPRPEVRGGEVTPGAMREIVSCSSKTLAVQRH